MLDSDPKTLVSTDWLFGQLGNPHLRIIDASWYLPAMQRDPYAEYLKRHIPGAVFFDIDDISDPDSPLPHMAPPIELFVSRMRAFGIGNAHQIVVYDGEGLFSAARVWWLFRLMGIENIAVLDGGLPKWQAEGRPTTQELPDHARTHLSVRYQSNHVETCDAIRAYAENGARQIVDARASARFKGEQPEPRAGMRSGHIPGSKNVFFQDLLDPDKTMKPTEDLQQVFRQAGVDLDKPIATSCGSGVTAAVLSLALERLGHRNHSLYDGSWSEWGQMDGPDIQTGEA